MLQLQFGNKKLETQKDAFVMGIVNATPDSFYEKSRGGIELALKLIEDGADILDIGGESTRPGFNPVSAEEEINRVIPLIREIRKESDIPISIDTSKFEVMKAAACEGADIFNDVTSLEKNGKTDEKKLQLVLENSLSLILMHQFYDDEAVRHTDNKITDVVKNYLLSKADLLVKNGFPKEKIILDPGIGFGKTPEENIMLIKSFCQVQKDYTVLMALSRKRVTDLLSGNGDKLTGTIAANLFAVKNGAKLIRVHDVKEAVASLNVMKYLK